MKWPDSHEYVKFWRNDINIALVYDTDSRPQGYILYELEDDKINVLSIRYTCLEALDALRHYIVVIPDLKSCSFSSIPPDFPLEFLTQYLATPHKAIVPYRYNNRMVRVVNFGALLEKLIVVWPEVPITFKVNDTIFPQNDAYFTTLPDKKVLRFGLYESRPTAYVVLDIKATAPLLCGMTSAEELYYGGRLNVSDNPNISQSRSELPKIVEQINDMLPKVITYNADEYLAP